MPRCWNPHPSSCFCNLNPAHVQRDGHNIFNLVCTNVSWVPFDFTNALVHYCDLRQICYFFRGLLTLTAWWAGTFNTTDWVITRKCSKLALTGPRLPKLPFRKVIWGVMHLGWGELLQGRISCVKLWSEWNCEASLWHLVINEMVFSLVTKTDRKKPTWSHNLT